MNLEELMHSLAAWLVPIIIIAVIILPNAVRVLREYERGVVFRLSAIATSCSWLQAFRSAPLGRTWRNRPFVFSQVPRCHGL